MDYEMAKARQQKLVLFAARRVSGARKNTQALRRQGESLNDALVEEQRRFRRLLDVLGARRGASTRVPASVPDHGPLALELLARQRRARIRQAGTALANFPALSRINIL